jgi:DNA-binding response OmpR family regulator
VVEDEEKILEVVSSYLEREGYSVLPAITGTEGLTAFERSTPDLVVLDLMLPDLPGEEVCRRIRRASRVPIIMLTAKVEEADKLRGFSLGADDYVVKPFSLRELVARIQALLRRSAREPLPLVSPLTFGEDELVMDFSRQIVTREGEPVKLTPKEYRILLTLASHPGRVFARDELIRYAIGEDFTGFDRTVDAHIKNLRKKLERDPNNPRYVLTVHGIGYRFSASLDTDKPSHGSTAEPPGARSDERQDRGTPAPRKTSSAPKKRDGDR